MHAEEIRNRQKTAAGLRTVRGIEKASKSTRFTTGVEDRAGLDVTGARDSYSRPILQKGETFPDDQGFPRGQLGARLLNGV